MTKETTPAKVRLSDQLGQVQHRAAFERLVLELTGRDMAYHAAGGTTGLDHAWISYQAGVAAERERCAKLCDEVAIMSSASSDGAARYAACSSAKTCSKLIRMSGETRP